MNIKKSRILALVGALLILNTAIASGACNKTKGNVASFTHLCKDSYSGTQDENYEDAKSTYVENNTHTNASCDGGADPNEHCQTTIDNNSYWKTTTRLFGTDNCADEDSSLLLSETQVSVHLLSSISCTEYENQNSGGGGD